MRDLPNSFSYALCVNAKKGPLEAISWKSGISFIKRRNRLQKAFLGFLGTMMGDETLRIRDINDMSMMEGEEERDFTKIKVHFLFFTKFAFGGKLGKERASRLGC